MEGRGLEKLAAGHNKHCEQEWRARSDIIGSVQRGVEEADKLVYADKKQVE